MAALKRQERIEGFELIAVDDCSTDDTLEVLSRLAASAPFPLTILRTERNAGPAVARNLGWRAARAPLIAFTDDDCLPEPRWLSRMVAAMSTADVVQGRTRSSDDAAGRGPFGRILAVDEFSWKFETCNVGYRRSVLEAGDGFDERFVILGEDCDLGWRAIRSGAQTAWAPDAEVVHRVDTTGTRIGDWVASLRITRRLVYAPLLVKEHPGFREKVLVARWFWSPLQPRTLAAVLGIVIAIGGQRRLGSRLMALGLLLPWLHYRTAIDPRPGRRRWAWAVIPMALVTDIAALAATVEGSVRYRTLVL